MKIQPVDPEVNRQRGLRKALSDLTSYASQEVGTPPEEVALLQRQVERVLFYLRQAPAAGAEPQLAFA